jgi:hypothetical protein
MSLLIACQVRFGETVNVNGSLQSVVLVKRYQSARLENSCESIGLFGRIYQFFAVIRSCEIDRSSSGEAFFDITVICE